MGATPKLSLILVCYGSSDLAAEAVRSFRGEAAELGLATEVVLVDHSEDEDEARKLGELAGTLVVQANRGYAAGINAGVRSSRGDVLLLGNPDVRFLPGSVAALLGGLEDGWDVVGPQFEIGGLLIPPADLHTPLEEVRRLAAGRWRWAWRRALARETRRWRGVWRAGGAVALHALSGALVGMRRDTFSEVGEWDEGYFLYFEEIEWFRRARSRGIRPALIPSARVVHHWAHVADPAAQAAHFSRSRRRFYRRHFGLLGAAITAVSPRTVFAPRRGAAAPSFAQATGLFLVSPNPNGLPSAGLYLSDRRLEEALQELAHDRPGSTDLTVIPIGDDGRPRACWQWSG